MNEWPNFLPTIPEFRAVVVRHGWKGCVLAVVLLAICTVAIFSLKRQYVSEAKVFVRLGHQSLTLDPTVTTNQTLAIYETRESEINSLMEILKSREVLAGVVRILGENAILQGGSIPEIPTEANLAANSTEVSAEAITVLEKMIHIWSPKRTNMIALGSKADSPQLAQAVLQAILVVYRDIHAEVNRTPGSFNFFQDQEAKARTRWELAAQELRQTKDKLSVASLEGKKAAQQTQLSDVEQQLQTTHVEIATAVGRIAAMEQKLRELPRLAESSQLNAVSDGARTSLFQLEAKRQELLSKYTESHPVLQMVSDQIAALQNDSAAGAPKHAQTTFSVNPAFQQIETNLHVEQTQLASWQARLIGLKQRQKESQEALENFNQAEVALFALQQRTDLAAQAHKETATKLEMARLQKALADDRVSNLNVVQPASYISKAVAPKRSLLFMLSAFVSVFTGTLFVLSHAFWNRHFTSIQAVAEMLQLPIIAPRSVPVLARKAGNNFAH